MSHDLYMRRCFELAQMAGGNTAPNPLVGAVLVYNNRIIGTGFHKKYGEAHAEVACIHSVLPEDRRLIPESVLYVNLEPCAHYGKTPPCAERILQEGIRTVVMANKDPFEQVQGRGIDLLRTNGVQVITGICEAAGRWLNRRFFNFHEKQRPYIILKWAATADGYIAPADRTRLAISNAQSQILVHKWRTEEAAIIVGRQTALCDNPRLTARLWQGPQPLRIVLDKQLQLPQTLHLYDQSTPTWIINEEKEGAEGTRRYLRMSFDNDLLPALMKELHKQNKLSLLVEGGAQLLQSFIDTNLWDEARILTAPHTLGGGIAAPGLSNATAAMRTIISGDRLEVYTNSTIPFTYPVGSGL